MRKPFVLLLLIAAVIAGVWVNFALLGPYGSPSQVAFVDVQHGAGSRAIAQQLTEKGIIRSPWAFLVVRLLHPRAPLQAGEYQFKSPSTPGQVFEKIRKGQVFYEELTIPEGSNLFDIANLLRSGDTVKAEDFVAAASDPGLIRDLDPTAPNLEGYLFPSTYRVTHKTTARQLCREMTLEFRRRWAALAASGVGTVPPKASAASAGRETGDTGTVPPGSRKLDVHRMVTLASLVEKETAIPAERALVAAVYNNRLSSGMLLQCDPTTVYAALLENRYRGVIHKSDLASANPYNTYLHPGLPPGPIANPGVNSLKAALAPAASPYLYFVARGDGTGAHRFSSTFAEHESAVAAFRHSTNH